jgi:hypothetical protein
MDAHCIIEYRHVSLSSSKSAAAIWRYRLNKLLLSSPLKTNWRISGATYRMNSLRKYCLREARLRASASRLVEKEVLLWRNNKKVL